MYNAETIAKKLENIKNVDKGLKHVHTNVKDIEDKIKNLEDVFKRNHKYEKILIDNKFPDYIRKNLNIFKEFILD